MDDIVKKVQQEKHEERVTIVATAMMALFDQNKESWGIALPKYEPYVLIDVAHVLIEHALFRKP